MTWQPGERLTVRGGDWRVLRATRFAACNALDLACERSATRRTLLLPFDRPRHCRPRRLAAVSSRRWSGLVSSLARTSFPYGGLQFCPPGIRLLPYQLEPALAIFRHGFDRVLIGDDVGLGKTVEAGLIVKEVAGGDRLARILILVPASLKGQWQEQLASLFSLQTVDAGAGWLRSSARAMPSDVNPWSLPGIYLASTDFIKRPEALGPLEDVRWDLLVVDEAHAATPSSDRRAAVHAVACRSSRIVLLSATPHSGDDEQFEQLCAIGSFSNSPPMVCFSRSRADTPLPSQSVRSRVFSVCPTDPERLMHRLLERYTSRLWCSSSARTGGNALLLATVLRKRALSGASAVAASVRRRLTLMGAAPTIPDQLWLPMDEEGGLLEDEPGDSVLSGAGLEGVEDERRLLESVLEAADDAACAESKHGVLVRLLRRVREPALVFSEYRDTAQRLRAVLVQHGHRVGLLHGGLSSEERRQAVAAFKAGGSLLVATDAASEGLNLHGACRLVIHFELPWTPVRLHQRCGRVNRIGQTRRVHEIALVAADTAEQLVLVPLLQRAQRSGRFGRGAIMRQLPETRVAAHVLGGTPLPGVEASRKRPNLLTLALADEGHQEAQRLELLRRLPAPPPSAATQPAALCPIACVRRRRRTGRVLTLLFSLMTRDHGGTVLEHLIATMTLQLRTGRWLRGAALRAQVASVMAASQSDHDREVRRIQRERVSWLPLREVAARRGLRRSTAMAGALGSTARGLVQAGLFDRRALRAAAMRRRAAPILTGGTPGPGIEDVEELPQLRTHVELRAVLCGGLE